MPPPLLDTLPPAAVHPPPADRVILHATQLENDPVGFPQLCGRPGHRWEGRENETNNDVKGATAESCRVGTELCNPLLGLLEQSTTH